MGTAIDLGIKGYKSYGIHLREKYNGQRVFKVIVDGGLPAPIVMEVKGMAVVLIAMLTHLPQNLPEKTQTLKISLQKACGVLELLTKQTNLSFIFNPIPTPTRQYII